MKAIAPSLSWYPLLMGLMACGSPKAPDPAPEPSPAEAAADPLERFRQLMGEWVDSTTTDRYTSFERWAANGDSALTGFGYVMSKGDTVFIEDLKMEAVGGSVVYSARIDSQNNGAWVPFTAQASGPDSLIFENPGHDFPQCITYVKDSTGAWEVSVTGNEHGQDRSERFRFIRR